LQKGRINQHIQDMLNDLSANKSHDRNPDYVRVFIEEYFKEMPKTVVSSIQPPISGQIFDRTSV